MRVQILAHVGVVVGDEDARISGTRGRFWLGRDRDVAAPRLPLLDLCQEDLGPPAASLDGSPATCGRGR